MHKDRRARTIKATGDKEVVLGIIGRGGRVRGMHISSNKKAELQRCVRDHIEAVSAIFSDALKSYDGLENDYETRRDRPCG